MLTAAQVPGIPVPWHRFFVREFRRVFTPFRMERFFFRDELAGAVAVVCGQELLCPGILPFFWERTAVGKGTG